jgi:hypothetical protein
MAIIKPLRETGNSIGLVDNAKGTAIGKTYRLHCETKPEQSLWSTIQEVFMAYENENAIALSVPRLLALFATDASIVHTSSAIRLEVCGLGARGLVQSMKEIHEHVALVEPNASIPKYGVHLRYGDGKKGTYSPQEVFVEPTEMCEEVTSRIELCGRQILL